MNRRLKPLISTCLLATSMSCFVDLDASYVEIQRALVPDTGCKVAAGNPLTTQGYYDPTFFSMFDYQLNLLLRNNVELASTDSLTFGPLGSARDQVTDMELVGFEGCWYQYSGDVTKLGNYQSGNIVDCATVPANQSGSIPASTEIDAGGGQSVAIISILTTPMLQSLFGSGFDMAKVLANPNNYVAGTAGIGGAKPAAGQLAPQFLAAPGDANSPTRDPAWGAKYPASLKAPVVFQLRAVMTNQGGETKHSNWFVFPITVCPTCFQSPCGAVSYVLCPNAACGDTTACGSGGPGLCTNGTQCGGLVKTVGSSITPGTFVCEPAQYQLTTLTCTAFNNCPATVYP